MITALSKFEESNGEITFEAKINDVSIKQRLSIEPPCIIVFNPSNNNLRMIPISLEEGETFVEILT